MKVTIAAGIYPPEIGGPATFLRELVPVLKKKGWAVDVITYGAPRAGVTSISRENPFRWWAFSKAVRNSARDADVILTTDTFSAGYPAFKAAHRLNKPLVTRFVGDAAWEISRSNEWTKDDFSAFQKKKYDWKIELLRSRQRKVLENSEIITVSRFLQSVLKKWGMKKKNVHIIPNAAVQIKLPSRDALRKKLGFDKKFVMLSVGRITSYKGVDKIIRMCAKLKTIIPELFFVVVGEGPALDKAKSAAREQMVTHIVQFLGKKDEVETRSLMKAADVLVLNSEYEGMSYTLLESMSVECPVVASDVCGNPELVKNRGLLFEYNNMEELREQVLKLYKNPDLRKKLAKNALKDLPKPEHVEKKVLEVLLKHARAND